MTAPADLLEVARRVVWFQLPEETVQEPRLFLAHLMTYGTIEDIAVARRHFSQDDFRKTLEQAPPGVFDGRSWAYWNVVFGRLPVPPLPRREFPDRGDAPEPPKFP